MQWRGSTKSITVFVLTAERQQSAAQSELTSWTCRRSAALDPTIISMFCCVYLLLLPLCLFFVYYCPSTTFLTFLRFAWFLLSSSSLFLFISPFPFSLVPYFFLYVSFRISLYNLFLFPSHFHFFPSYVYFFPVFPFLFFVFFLYFL